MTDFLNNLWVAVSTPNPELIKILSILQDRQKFKLRKNQRIF